MSPARPSRAGLTNPFRWPPGFVTYYTIGVRAGKRLPAFSTFQQVGDSLGISKQQAYTECAVTLGKFLYRLVKIVGEVPEL